LASASCYQHNNGKEYVYVFGGRDNTAESPTNCILGRQLNWRVCEHKQQIGFCRYDIQANAWHKHGTKVPLNTWGGLAGIVFGGIIF
jgi:hypothetical protein